MQNKKKQWLNHQKHNNLLEQKTSKKNKKIMNQHQKETVVELISTFGLKHYKYFFPYSHQNLEMFILIDNDVTKKNSKVNISMDKLEITVKGQSLINGKWKGKINTE